MAEVGEAGRLREEVRTLREENTKLKQTLGEATNALVDKQDKEDEEEDEEDDDDDMMLEIDETQVGGFSKLVLKHFIAVLSISISLIFTVSLSIQ